MKFRTHTQLLTAYFKDVELAGAQGTISSIKFNDFKYGQSEMKKETKNTPYSWAFLLFSGISFVWAAKNLNQSRSSARQQHLKVPLVSSGGVAA
jgi:hypothetical protein